MNTIDNIPNFVPVGGSSSYNVLALGAGVIGIDMYTAADKFGVIASGGFSPSVGMAGGYLIGGGIGGPFATEIGFAADSSYLFCVAVAQISNL